MKTEAKVGAFTLAGIALLVVIIVELSGFSFSGNKGYTLYAGFTQVIGVEPQSTVRLSGVPVGTVKGIANEGGGVVVTLNINADAKIPQGSKVTIGSSGVMGEKFVNILPAKDMGRYVQNGDYIIGEDEAGMDTMFAGMNKTLEQVQDLLMSMQEVVGNKELQTSLVNTTKNMQEASLHVSLLVSSLERMAVGSEQDIRHTTANLHQITESMTRTMASVEQTMANLNTVGGDPKTAENLRLTLQNIMQTSERVERMAANMEKVVGDPQTAEDLKATVHNARALSDKAGKLLGGSGLKVEPSVDVMYSGEGHDWKTNIGVEAGQKVGTYVKLGVDDVGEGDKVNAQIGTRGKDFGFRAGAVTGKAGVGVDAYGGKNFRFSLDAYDPNDPTLRIESAYRMNEGTYLIGQIDEVNSKENRKGYVGIRQSF